MAKRQNPWPRGLRIDRANDPLAALPESHPARQTVLAHAACRRDCVGLEIEWVGHEDRAIDQSWHSQVLGRTFAFSSYAYVFLSFDLVLEEWLQRPAHVTADERRYLRNIPLLNSLLNECRSAARHARNAAILDLLPQVQRFNRLHSAAIRLRLREDGLPIPRFRRAVTPAAVLAQLFPETPASFWG